MAVAIVGATSARYEVKTKDISLGGACLLAGSAFEIGTMLTLHVPWVDADGQPTKQTEPLSGRVVWMTLIEAEYQLGVVFDASMGEAAKRCLQDLCAALALGTASAPPLPKRTFDLS